MNKNLLIFVLFILFSAAANVLLSVAGIPGFLIFLGFRIHPSAFIAAVLLGALGSGKKSNPFARITCGRLIGFALYLLLLGGFTYAAVFMKLLQPANPDFVYEFGISSLIDFPLYIIWNFPQMLALYMLIDRMLQQPVLKYFTPILSLSIISGEIFAIYKQLPQGEILLVIAAGVLFFSFVSIKAKNAVEFAAWSFLGIWIPVLLAGSGNAALIKMFFAKNYTEWDGFVQMKGVSRNYLAGGLMIVETLPLLFMRNKQRVFNAAGKTTTDEQPATGA